MFTYRPYINVQSGNRLTKLISLREEACSNGVTAVFVDAISREYFDADFGIGIDVTVNEKIKGYMADYRRCEFWCQPSFGRNLTDIPDETQALILELENGKFCAVVPVVNDKYKTVFKGCGKNEFMVRMFSWCDKLNSCKGLSFVYAVGKSVAGLVESCVKEALKLLGTGVRHRTQRRYPGMFEYLGWCSWDSMQIRVSEDGMVEKCKEFKEKGIPVKWAILDDMWADVRDFYGRGYNSFDEMMDVMHSSKLWNYETDPIRFPNGLAGCISKVNEYGISVGIWHPTTGYWKGIDPDGEAYKRLKDCLIESYNNQIVHDWHQEKAYMYYKTIHDYFRQCGAEFVKIDNQTMIERYYKGLAPVGQIAKEYHGGMEASVGEHFDNCMINCMGMGSEDMWSRSVSPLSRCSGDFMPEDKEWFTTHILMCAYNSVIQGQFYWCDWDMWWTDDGQGAKNSLMRAISGGPVYVSDKIGRSRKELLFPLTLSDGRILRCDRPCIPTDDCMTVDPRNSRTALKLQNMSGKHGIMAVINLDEEEKAVTAKISGDDIYGFEADEYAVYEHFSKDLKILKKGESFNIELKNSDDYRLYIFAPIKDGFAVIGRTDKFISPKTVKYVTDEKITLYEEGDYAYVKDGKLVLNIRR